jgi:hypothetical protein
MHESQIVLSGRNGSQGEKYQFSKEVQAVARLVSRINSREWVLLRLLFAVAVLAMITSCVVAGGRPKHQSNPLLAAVDRFYEAFDAKDCDTLYKYVSDEERAKLGLTPKSFASFMNLIVFPSFEGMATEAAVKTEPSLNGLMAERPCRQGDRRGGIGVTLNITDRGPRASCLIVTLYLQALQARCPDGSTINGANRYMLWATGTRQLLPLLQQSGVSGVALLNGKIAGQKDEIYTWSEWIKHCEASQRNFALSQGAKKY